MAKTRKRATPVAKELDSEYILKLAIYMVIGSLWLRVTWGTNMQLPIPYGLLIGLLVARHDRFQVDRKIEYAVLLVAAFIGFWLPVGLIFSV